MSINNNSTLNQELNRLANGGTYRTNDQMVDSALAAKQWAIAKGITPYHPDTVGVLNDIAGITGPATNHLDYSGICNKLADTTGLPAAQALRNIPS